MKRSSHPSSYLAHGTLFLCSIIWGGAFVFQKIAMAHMSPLLFNMLRCLISVLFLWLFICVYHRKTVHKKKFITNNEFKVGACIGVILWLALGFQQIGLVDTTASKASFITGLYIIFVPFVLKLFFSGTVASCQLSMASLACLGLFLLTTSVHDFGIGNGDLWVLASAVMWAVHVSILGQYHRRGRVLQIAMIQMLSCALLSGISSLLLMEPWSGVLAVLPSLLFTGLLSGGIAFTLQLFGQNTISSPVAAIILSFEAVFGAWAGWYFLHEPFSLRNLMGALLIMLAITLVEVTNYLQLRAKRIGLN
jgi:drug/metabolite transporter (DMT)-like permease